MNEASNSKFVTRKWNIIVNDQSDANYDVANEIICNTEVWKSNLCDLNDVYILVKGEITINGHNVTQNMRHLLNVSQNLMEQQYMMLKI